VHTDAAIVDLDGTVYRGDALLPGAREGIAALRDAGVAVLFFSNNPTRTPADYAAQLTDLGIDTGPSDVLTSGTVTAAYLRETHSDAAVFVVGEEGLRRQLSGNTLVDDPESADVVVGSIDREFTYERLTEAYRALDTAYAFIGTDPDRTIPAGEGRNLPGTGAILSAISTAAERDPTILGKPSRRAASAALSELDVSPDRCLVIGDRLDTDVAMAGRAGMRSALVLTGAHGEPDIDRFEDTPDYVLESLAAVENVVN